MDKPVLDAHEYLELSLYDGSADARLKALELYPEIAAAEALQHDPPRCEPLKIMVLAGCEPVEIADKTGLSQAVVEAWEALFFDVRPAREAIGWIMAHVVHPEERDGNTAFISKLKAAFAGGPEIARQILESETALPLAEGARLFDRQLRLELKLDQALGLPLDTSTDKLRFLQWYYRRETDRVRLELEKQKFEFRMEEVRRKQRAAEALLERRVQERERERQHQEQLQRDLRRTERAAAELRARHSPLAQLTWNSSAQSDTALARSDTPSRLHEREVAASPPAGRHRIGIRTGTPGRDLCTTSREPEPAAA